MFSQFPFKGIPRCLCIQVVEGHHIHQHPFPVLYGSFSGRGVTFTTSSILVMAESLLAQQWFL